MLYRANRHRSDVGTVVLAAALAVIAAGLLVSGCSKEEPETEEVIRPVKMMTIGAGAVGGVRDRRRDSRYRTRAVSRGVPWQTEPSRQQRHAIDRRGDGMPGVRSRLVRRNRTRRVGCNPLANASYHPWRPMIH